MKRRIGAILGILALAVGTVVAAAGPATAAPPAESVLVVDAEGQPVDGTALRNGGGVGTLALTPGASFDGYVSGVQVHFANAYQWLDRGNSWTFGNARLSMQTDGNLVVYNRHTGAARWASHTYGSGSVQMLFQPDDNLVLYTGTEGRGTAKWSSGTYHRCNSAEAPLLGLQADSNFVIYCGTVSGGNLYVRAIWATNTVM
ncbi:MAG TPA: hypothetical protein VNV66_01880 [Pilimelia sp.]|nr:hypothetical protein [Pilimelia sp.]